MACAGPGDNDAPRTWRSGSPSLSVLSSEVEHIDSEGGEHALHVFQAWRNMDEILLNNFMVFHDLVEQEAFDLWIGDEAWELDHYLHENPEQKRAPFVWLTDFVGWLPMPEGGEREAFLAADYNVEMIEHIDRYPKLRDLSVFVGNPDDIVPDRFGAGLPAIREWTEQHYDFAGYVIGFDPTELVDRAALRDQLGYGPDEKICIVSVGGSGVGTDLLRRASRVLHRGAAGRPRLTHDGRHRAADRPRVAAPPGWRGGTRLYPRPVPPSGRVRHRTCAGWPHHVHGADGDPATLPLLPAS